MVRQRRGQARSQTTVPRISRHMTKMGRDSIADVAEETRHHNWKTTGTQNNLGRTLAWGLSGKNQ